MFWENEELIGYFAPRAVYLNKKKYKNFFWRIFKPIMYIYL